MEVKLLTLLIIEHIKIKIKHRCQTFVKQTLTCYLSEYTTLSVTSKNIFFMCEGYNRSYEIMDPTFQKAWYETSKTILSCAPNRIVSIIEHIIIY